jgi:ubiquinone/menaquinone biosynthesis C-methylase UbiE
VSGCTYYTPAFWSNHKRSDRFTEILLRQLNSNRSPTFHDYGLTPPLNILDLGCGHGGWVVEAATAWKNFGTKVTGFDLVDVASRSGEADEASLDNITWVQGNLCVNNLYVFVNGMLMISS